MIKNNIQIRFSDIDSFGHVNNIVLQNYYDYGKMRYLYDSIGLPVSSHNPSMVIASTASNYYLPTLMNGNVEVETKVVELGEKSVKFSQRLIDIDTGDIKSDCETIMVALDIVKGCSVELLPEWIDAICAEEKKTLKELKKVK